MYIKESLKISGVEVKLIEGATKRCLHNSSISGIATSNSDSFSCVLNFLLVDKIIQQRLSIIKKVS